MEYDVKGKEGYRQWLAPYLSAWTRHGIRFGIAGGWNSIQKYGDCFHAACVDIGMSDSGLMRMRPALPPGVDLALAVSGDVMIYRFPNRYDDPAKCGLVNDHFLDADLLQEQLASCMHELAQRMNMILLPVHHVYRTEGMTSAMFIDRLARFLDALPHTCRCAIEMHNAEYLVPEYFACLRERNSIHVLNTAPAMPSVLDQAQHPHALTADVAVVRTPLSMNPELQLGIIEAVRRCIDEQRTLYVYCGEEEQHSMLPSLATLMDMLNPNLAKLSPIRQKAA